MNLQELKSFFNLEIYRPRHTYIKETGDIGYERLNYLARIKWRHKKTYSAQKINEKRDEIYKELVDPLFIKPSINVKYEANPKRHRKDNLFCLFEVLLRDLKRIKKKRELEKFKDILREFHLNYKKIVPFATSPFSWMLESKKLIPEETTTYKLKQELEELNEKMGKINKRRDEIMDCFLEDSFFTKKWRKTHAEIEEVEIKIDRLKKREYILSDKLDQAIKLSERILRWLKMARGKPGRHPKPLNVFVYHLINKCTRWKIDENRNYVKHEDGQRKGQYKLESDWKQILFLMLEIYLCDEVKLPEIGKFISDNKKTSAHDALKLLKENLNDRYKNFPRKEGWPVLRKLPETGFRKLIVTNDGTLHVVRL